MIIYNINNQMFNPYKKRFDKIIATEINIEEMTNIEFEINEYKQPSDVFENIIKVLPIFSDKLITAKLFVAIIKNKRNFIEKKITENINKINENKKIIKCYESNKELFWTNKYDEETIFMIIKLEEILKLEQTVKSLIKQLKYFNNKIELIMKIIV